jgi:hypothetical protein
MQVSVTRTGGLAGVHQQLGPVEISSLDPEVANQIERILAGVDFFNLPERLPTQGNVADGFFYAVRAVADGRDHTVRTDDGSEDPAAVQLRELTGLLDEAVGRFENHSADSAADAVPTRGWSAWYNRMPGTDDPDLHVSGTCSLESSNITVQLEPGNEGVIDDPELYVLRLVVTRPAVLDDLCVERDVNWQGAVGPAIKRVRINGVPDEIPVMEAV